MGNLADFKEVLYHTGLSTAMIEKAEYAILPGDPGREKYLLKHLEKLNLLPATENIPVG